MDSLPGALYALRDIRQFINYKLVANKTRSEKTDKLPVNSSGQLINAHDPLQWVSADVAISAAQLLGPGYGVGFVFTEHTPFWFLDIDNCQQSDNSWSPLAIELCTLLQGAAVEISSSGKGLHIFGAGRLPPHGCKNNPLGLELYSSGRFVALTGLNMIGDISRDCSAVLPTLVNRFFPLANTASPAEWTEGPCLAWRGSVDDAELIQRALKSNSRRCAFGTVASFKDLYECNTEVLCKVYQSTTGNEYDASSADAALAQHLAFWTGNDCERIKRLMLGSKLNRGKWEREDYLYRTILNACARQTEWCKDKPAEVLQTTIAQQPASLQGQMVAGTTFLTGPQQIELFKGCIYVREDHKILVPGGDLLKPDQFRTAYGGYSLPMDQENSKVTRNAWEAFTESQLIRFPKAHASCFKPILAPAAILENDGRLLVNIWWPVMTPRKSGDPSMFLQLLRKLIPDDFDREILLCYMAAVIQHKGVKFQWAPLIQGVEGNGKTTLTRCIAHAIGDMYTHKPRGAELVGKYNSWLYKTLFIGVEDLVIPESNADAIETLKPMVTEERLPIRSMYSNEIMRDICCNFIINTNHKDGLRKTQNDRRFAHFYCAQQASSDLTRDGLIGDYFPRLYDWLQNHEGYAIVADLFHTYKIAPELNPANKKPAPITTSTKEAIEHGLGGVEQEIIEAIEQGVPGFRGDFISSVQLEHLLERIHATRKVPQNRRRAMLQALGYDWHPALPNGRVNNIVTPDQAKPKLFIKTNSPTSALTNPTDIAHAYSVAQSSIH